MLVNKDYQCEIRCKPKTVGVCIMTGRCYYSKRFVSLPQLNTNNIIQCVRTAYRQYLTSRCALRCEALADV